MSVSFLESSKGSANVCRSVMLKNKQKGWDCLALFLTHQFLCYWKMVMIDYCFPIIKKKGNVIDGIWRIFLMASIFAMVVCFIINYEFPHHGFWCRFVAGGVFTSWILLFVLMKKYKNVLKCLFY